MCKWVKKSMFYLASISMLLAVGCDDEKSPEDTGTTKTPLTCLTFSEDVIRQYAMTHWDHDGDGCLSDTEAAGVISIPDGAFANNQVISSLDDLNLFPNLTGIGASAFAGCTGLQTANLDHVVSVGDSAFSGCTGLVQAEMPNATSIAANAFDNCPNLPQASECPASCSNGCDENGGCKDIVVTCPETCKTGCDETGKCKDGVPVCPVTCKTGCDDSGNCMDTAPACPQTCKSGCNKAGKCKDDILKCPESCKTGCDKVGKCKDAKSECPSTCINGCDDDGNCKDDIIECPSACINGCDDDGNCKDDIIECPSTCINGCDDDGNCKDVDEKCETNGQLMCDNDKLMKCKNHKWTFNKNCQYGCSNDQCNICRPGRYVCGDEIDKDAEASYKCEGDKWVYDKTCSIWVVDCNPASGHCEACRKDQEGELACQNDNIVKCTDYHWEVIESCIDYGCGTNANPMRCYTTPFHRYKCSEDKTSSLHSDGFGWTVDKVCENSLCNDETGKCSDEKIYYCGNSPASDVKFDWYDSNIPIPDEFGGEVIWEDYYIYRGHVYEDFVSNNPNATFDRWCAQHGNRIGICSEVSSNPVHSDWKNYNGGDCYMTCSQEDEGKDYLDCEGYFFGNEYSIEQQYIGRHGGVGDNGECSAGYAMSIASRYVCTKLGNHYVYLPVDSVNNCECDYSSNDLCSQLYYDESTFKYQGCKKYRPECSDNCANGCDSNGNCSCPLKCHGNCDEQGNCQNYPCADSCTYGCWYSEDPTQCLDVSQCNCTHEYMGPGVWSYQCDYDECKTFYPDDWD